MYDGDGKRVKSTFNGTTTTYFVGNHYEVTGSTITKYYYAGAQRIAMRTNGILNYLLGDHLGSTSLITDATGYNPIETRYKAWGETRYASGTAPTKYTYTGQYSYTPDFGLMYYNARWYDPSLGRFAQADSIIPQNQGVQAWDRYAYTNNNPVRYTDPSGHDLCQFLVSLSGGSLSCPGGGANDLGALINVGAKDEGKADIYVTPPPDAIPGAIIDPPEGQMGSGALINVPGQQDDEPEGYDPAPDDGLGIIAETEDDDEGEDESPYGFPDNNGEPPVAGWVWRGKGEPGSSQGQWVNPDAPKENLHWDDTNHLDEYPDGHWDYRDPYGNEFRIGPKGLMTPK